MSCSLNLQAVIPDLKELKSILFPGTLSDEELKTSKFDKNISCY